MKWACLLTVLAVCLLAAGCDDMKTNNSDCGCASAQPTAEHDAPARQG
jgi:hypothetical protein